MTTTYVPSTPTGQVRLLLSDIAEPFVFTDEDITAFLAMEANSVKRAAAQALDTNATNEALASKVIKTQDVSTDGAQVADALRKHAAALRAQAAAEEDAADEGGYFALVPPPSPCYRPPELTEIF